MEEIVINELMHDGMRRVRLMADSPLTMPTLRWLQLVPSSARSRMQTTYQDDLALGIYSMDLIWPVFEPFDIAIGSPKKFRRVLMVHYSYAERVSDVIKLAVDAFITGTNCLPQYAWVREIPKGAEDWIEIYGVIMTLSEIAPSNCVLIGGMA